MNNETYPQEFLDLLRTVTSKRPRTVIEHILKNGFITTEDLERDYGYKHPPRAARDVREQGIPLETFSVKARDGRTIAAYRFGNPSMAMKDKLGGRQVFSKDFKDSLLKESGCRCFVCLEDYESRYLQVDHRIPYEVCGDSEAARKTDDYMLLCGSCNRAKSWSCEHCVNWLEDKSPEACLSCYWAHPEFYRHIALRPIRRLDVVWSEDEIKTYERLRQKADELDVSFPDYVKRILEERFKNE